MIARIDEARAHGDTVGGVFEVVAHGLPIGLGSYVHWDRRLDAALAAAVMSINIVKGVELGLGFEQTRRFGSAVHDVIEGRGASGPLDPSLEQRRRSDRRHHERRAARRARRGQADLHPRPAPAVGRPRHRRGGREGPLRAERHQRRARGRRRRRGDGACSRWPTSCSTSSAATPIAETADNLARYVERIAPAPEAPVAGGRRAHRAPDAAGGAAPTARPAPAGTTEARWTSSSSGCPAAARAPSDGAWPPPRRALHRPRRHDRGGGRRADPGDLRGRGRGRLPGPRAGGVVAARAGRPGPELRRVIATGGGAVVDPRNRWRLYRGRRVGLARRRARGRSPSACATARTRGRSSRAATRSARSAIWPPRASASTPPGRRVNGLAELGTVVDAVDAILGRAGRRRDGPAATRRHSIGRLVIGDGIAGRGARRAARAARRRAGRSLVSEPGAWAAVGAGDRGGLAAAGLPRRARACCPQGEAAKRLAVIENAARRAGAAPRRAARAARRDRRRRARRRGRVPGRDLAARRAARSTSRRRSSPSSTARSAARRPSTCRRARTSSAPSTSRRRSSIDVAVLADAARAAAAGRPRRGGQDGGPRRRAPVRAARARRRRDRARRRCGLRRRAPWPRSSSGRPGPRSRSSWPTSASRGAAGGPDRAQPRPLAGPCASRRRPATRRCSTARPSPTGSRAACRIGLELGVTPPERAARIEALLDGLGLGVGRLPLPASAVLEHLGRRQEARRRPRCAGSCRRPTGSSSGRTSRAELVDAVAVLLAPARAGRHAPGAGR